MKELRKQLRFQAVTMLISFATVLFLLSGVSVEPAEQLPLEPKQVALPVPGTALPVAEIAPRAAEASNILRTLESQLTPSPALETIRKELPQFNDHVNQLLEGTSEILQEQPPLATLQAQRQIWEAMRLHANDWLKALTDRAVQLRDGLNRLAGLQETWMKTDESARTANAPDAILEQSGGVLAAITKAQQGFQAQRSNILDLQNRVAEALGRCSNVVAQIGLAQKEAVGGILVRDGLPIWSPHLWVQAQSSRYFRFRATIGNCREDIQQYLSNPSAGMRLHVGIFLGLMLLLWAARWRVDRWKRAGDSVPSAAAVFDHPFAAALICMWFVAAGPVSPTPQTVKSLMQMAALVPMIRLAQPVIDRRVHPGLYALAILFTIDVVRRTFEGLPLVGQGALLLETAAGILTMGWLLTRGQLRRAREMAKGLSQFHVLRVAVFLVLFALAAAFLTGVVGYMRLAGLLASEILGGSALALAFCACFQLATGVVALALRVWPLKLLRMVQHHRDPLERRVRRILIWMSLAGWGMRWLAYMGLLGPAFSLGGAILAMNLERGSVNISIGDVLVFFVTVWAAYLLSAFIRFLLQEDVYPRTQIAPGLSYAVSSLLHYVILALGVIVGMGLMGMDLSRVTVLAGAFGVGIGFGLQSVVNNFVCGLILLFERPIHLGDMIEIGDLLGEVRRIGIRASIVRTRQGADIVVPNAQLITDKVTNWTLNDKLRRLQLPVGVNYDASPKKVIEILEAVARNTPRVLQNPPPRALFMSYGDSSINFELRAWTDESVNWRQVRSDLAIAVYDAVKEAGMTFPFPQREVRVLKDRSSPEETEYLISNKEPKNVEGG
jgi:potassium-dependent mechanosensitive channel